MDVLTIEGKNYVKSSVIARELGYTSDYVGQLCRSGKVDAKLFGRTWYVEKGSIGGHKETRYRTSNAVTKKVLALQKFEVQNDNLQTNVKNNQNFYGHIQQKPVPRYISDKTELIPATNKEKGSKKSLQINLADATNLEIDSKDSKYIFETPSLPEIRFKGKLKVSNIEDTENTQDSEVIDVAEISPKATKNKDNFHHIHPKEVTEIKHKKAKNSPINKVISSLLKKKKSAHVRVHEDVTEDGLVSVHLQESTTQVEKFSFIPTFVALVIGSLCLVFLLSLSAKLEWTPNSFNTKYILEPKVLVNEVTTKLNSILLHLK